MEPNFLNSLFNFAVKPFNFPVGLWVFHPGLDVFDTMMIQEILERVLRVFPVPDRNKLGTMFGQDLAGGFPYSWNSWVRTAMVFSVVGDSNTP